MKIDAIRRQNVRALVELHSATKLATMLGYKQSSFLSQMIGPNPSRPITEKTARSFEQRLLLPDGSLDIPQEAVTAAEVLEVSIDQSSAENYLTLALNATRAVGQVCEDEAVTMSTSKFADVLALVLNDSFEHGVVRDTYTKQVVCLLK